jgi:hypothetical protein
LKVSLHDVNVSPLIIMYGEHALIVFDTHQHFAVWPVASEKLPDDENETRD